MYDWITTIIVFLYANIIYPFFSAVYGAIFTQELYTGIGQFDKILLALDAVGIMYLFVLLDKAGLFRPGSDKHIINWYTIPQALGVRAYWVFLFIFVSLAYCAFVWWWK